MDKVFQYTDIDRSEEHFRDIIDRLQGGERRGINARVR
jgi:hypothetical protein